MHYLIRSARRVLLIGLLFAGFAVFASAHAAGLLTPADGSTPPLTIKSHDVQVSIEDGYAITQVDQVFANPHGADLEARYSFPVPERGTVAEFTVWIDGKPVVGEVLRKEKARQIYQQEKAAGREAGLTEKDEYKTFEVMVSPVRAGQDTRVRLVYLQPAFVDTGIGRYVYPLEDGGVDERKMSFWTGNPVVEEQFSFKLNLRSGYPVAAMRLPDFPQASTQAVSPQEWTVAMSSRPSAGGAADLSEPSGAQPPVADTARRADDDFDGAPASRLMPAEAGTGVAHRLDKDIVVYWRHAENQPGAVDLVAYKPEDQKRGTFMMTVTPAADLAPITTGKDWIFVLDVSGSMSGKLATLAEGVRLALGKLNPEDRFRIVLFSRSAREMTSGWTAVTAENVHRAAQQVAQLRPESSTNLYAGLKMGMQYLDADRPAGIVLVTDGVANVGETEVKRFLDLLNRYDIRLFTAVMGNSANRPLLDSMTRASNGFAVSVSNSDDIVGQLELAAQKVTHQALHDVEIDIDGVNVGELTPSRIGSVYRGGQIILMGHYFGSGPANVELRARVSGKPLSYKTRFEFPAVRGANPEIERLWAYARILELQGEMDAFGADADREEAVADLGIEYGLVTDYTSMLVLREEMFSQYGIDRNNANRRQIERIAAEQRKQQTPSGNRVDQQQPMFEQRARPSLGGGGGGGGAIGPWGLILLLPLLALRRRVLAGVRS